MAADPLEATSLKTTRDLTKSPHWALKQIETRRYDPEMVATGVTDVLGLGIAFRGTMGSHCEDKDGCLVL